MNPETAAVAFGLVSAASWGAGNFSGGMASKRQNAMVVVAIAQAFGAVLLVTLALLWGEAIPSLSHLGYGALAGVVGSLGLAALYRGLATANMGIVAPMTAVIAAALPVLFAIISAGLPGNRQLGGFVIAFAGIWTISRQGRDARLATRALLLSLIAGIGFGLFYIFIDQVSESAVFWPLVITRLTSTALLSLILLRRRQAIRRPLNLPHLALTGILETGGSIFFALASASGRLDIAAVLSSLYPAATVFLAWLVLKERLSSRQWVGVAATLSAIVLITS